MKTPDLIDQLAASLEPRRGSFLRRSAAAGLGGTLAVAALALWLLPIRPDLVERVGRFFFHVESGLWVTAFFAAAALAYRSAIPALWRRGDGLWIAAPLVALTGSLLLRETPAGLKWEFFFELDPVRGWCGPLMLGAGLLGGALFLFLARQGAPTRPRRTAALAALAGGCLGGVLMQVICFRDNPLHIVLWHYTPLLLLAGAGSLIGKRLLRW